MNRRDIIKASLLLPVGLPINRIHTMFDTKRYPSQRELLLWCATVRKKPFAERVKAAKAAGFSAMTLFPLDYKNTIEQGLSGKEMRQVLRDHDLRVDVIDPYTKWYPVWEPPTNMSKEDVSFTDFEEEEVFTMAETLEARSINVIESFGKKAPVDQVVESFAGVCDRAAARGNWTVHLEFMPFSGIADLATAWEIVRTANRNNGGILLDTWHYYRSNPDHELLKTIPGDKIFRVQLADADHKLNGNLMNDLLHYRKLPGQGEFDLATVLKILQETGGINSIGPEIFADKMDALSAQQAAEQAMNATQKVLSTI